MNVTRSVKIDETGTHKLAHIHMQHGITLTVEVADKIEFRSLQPGALSYKEAKAFVKTQPWVDLITENA